jgi:hypothetical protein
MNDSKLTMLDLALSSGDKVALINSTELHDRRLAFPTP